MFLYSLTYVLHLGDQEPTFTYEISHFQVRGNFVGENIMYQQLQKIVERKYSLSGNFIKFGQNILCNTRKIT